MAVKLEDLDHEELLKLWSHLHKPCGEDDLRRMIQKMQPAEQVQEFIDELCESGDVGRWLYGGATIAPPRQTGMTGEGTDE